MQPFKANDQTEQKLTAAAGGVLDRISSDRSDLLHGAFQCFKLGEVLFDLDRDPLAGVITRETYRSSFFAIHDLFTRPGTFEFYLEVFRAIWGPEVEVEFTVPGPGRLQINIQALTIITEPFLQRRIVDNQYVFEEVTDHDGDPILFQVTQGIKTQSETDALMFELQTGGVFVETTLVIV